MPTVKLTYSCPDENCEQPISILFTPAIAPTIRLDPNDSDPGDCSEADMPERCPKCQRALDYDEVFDWCLAEVARRY